MNSYCLCAIGQQQLMPSRQDQGECDRTQSQQNDEDLLQHGIGVHDEVQAAVRADEANNSHGIGLVSCSMPGQTCTSGWISGTSCTTSPHAAARNHISCTHCSCPSANGKRESRFLTTNRWTAKKLKTDDRLQKLNTTQKKQTTQNTA